MCILHDALSYVLALSDAQVYTSASTKISTYKELRPTLPTLIYEVEAPLQPPLLFFFFLLRPPPRSPLFPYTTLFRSVRLTVRAICSIWARLKPVDVCGQPRPALKISRNGRSSDGIRTRRLVIAALPAHERSSCQVDRKSTRLNSSHQIISYAVFCLKK